MTSDTRSPADPANPLGHLAWAVERHQAGQLDEAERLYRSVLAAMPTNSDALRLMGVLGLQRGQPAQALDWLDRALAQQPRYPEAWINRALALKALGRPDEAEASFRQAIAQDSTRPQAAALLADLLFAQDRLAEAQTLYETALRRQPGHPAYLANLGACLLKLGHPDRAQAPLAQAQAAQPEHAGALMHLGLALMQTGQTEPALAKLELATRLRPDLPDTWWNLALARLNAGHLSEGWAAFAHRFGSSAQPEPARVFGAPAWDGQRDLSQKRVLVWREQGVGDEIIFASALPDLIARAGSVIVECSAKLIPLFARSFPEAEFRPEDRSQDPRRTDIDTHLPMGDLFRFLRPDLASFKGGPPYLVPDPERIDRWRKRLAVLGPGPKVGIGWRSGMTGAQRILHFRNGIDDGAALFRVPEPVFVALQYGQTIDEIAQAERQYGVRLHRFDDLDLFDDLDELAAALAALDLMIGGPGTATDMLAGAVGTPSWLTYLADAHWDRLGTDGLPWSGSTRLFPWRWNERRKDAFDRMALALAEFRPGKERASPPKPTAPPHPLGLAALQALAELHHKAGRPEKALPLYRQALAADPDFVPARINLAALCEAGGRFIEALDLLERAEVIAPAQPLIPFNRGNVLKKLGRKREAEAAWRQALGLDPGMIDAAINLADLLTQGERPAEAEALLRDALIRAPGEIRLINPLAKAIKEQDRPEAALAILDQALRANPDDAKLLANRGGLLRILERPAEALADLDRALVLSPDWPDAQFNRGAVLRETGRLAEAVAAFDRALARAPDDWEARWNRAIALLAQGRLEEGWADYALRWHESALMRTYPQPLWDGIAPLAGKTVFVWREQGVGDEISFASALPDLIARAGRVILECSPKLMPLMRRSFPAVTITDAAPGAFDLHLPIGDLFRHFRAAIVDFPKRQSYLMAPQKHAIAGPGLKVGIAWRSTKVTRERARHFFADPLELAPLLTVPGVRFVNLQAKLAPGEIERLQDTLGVTIETVPGLDLFDDLDGTAALMAGLDLVIANGSATAILAGALGVPTGLFYVAHSHWDRLGTDIIPWLPSVTLWTRKMGEGWERALGEARRHLIARSTA